MSILKEVETKTKKAANLPEKWTKFLEFIPSDLTENYKMEDRKIIDEVKISSSALYTLFENINFKNQSLILQENFYKQ